MCADVSHVLIKYVSKHHGTWIAMPLHLAAGASSIDVPLTPDDRPIPLPSLPTTHPSPHKLHHPFPLRLQHIIHPSIHITPPHIPIPLPRPPFPLRAVDLPDRVAAAHIDQRILLVPLREVVGVLIRDGGQSGGGEGGSVDEGDDGRNALEEGFPVVEQVHDLAGGGADAEEDYGGGVVRSVGGSGGVQG